MTTEERAIEERILPVLSADAFEDKEEEETDEQGGEETEGEVSVAEQEQPPSSDERENLLRLQSFVSESVQQALALERQRAELAEAAAREERRYKEIQSIEDEDERREKLAELGAETLKKREEDAIRTRFRDEYARELWADIQRVAPEIGDVFKEQAETLRSAKTDGELIILAGRALAAKDIAAREARIKELEAALEAQKNAAVASKSRRPPVELPEGTPGPSWSEKDLKDPIAIMSSAFKEMEGEEEE